LKRRGEFALCAAQGARPRLKSLELWFDRYITVEQ
jgi:hypothetical protein